MSLLGIIESGDVVGAVKKIWSLIFGSDMPAALASLVAKFSTDEGQIVWNAGTTAATDLDSGKSISQAAADAWTIIKDQVPSMALSDLEDAIGIQARANVPPSTEASADTQPATA